MGGFPPEKDYLNNFPSPGQVPFSNLLFRLSSHHLSSNCKASELLLYFKPVLGREWGTTNPHVVVLCGQGFIPNVAETFRYARFIKTMPKTYTCPLLATEAVI
jgi:hypothetical protein